MALLGLLAAIYFFAIRPSQLRWGATAEDVARSMPGDNLVPSPNFCATRAVTIQATPEEIWPWLVQMGFRRAGFYGYDLIENLGSGTGIRSADAIRPALQHPKTGDVLPISVAASMVFGEIKPAGYLIWQGKGTGPSDGSFVWVLYPVDANHTRLVSRVRLHYHWNKAGLLALDIFTEFADHVAVPRILLGIKDRVEGRPVEPLAEQAVEIVVWLLAMAEFAAAIVLVFRRDRWGRAWCFGLAAGLLTMFTLYAHSPTWIGAVLAFLLLGAMLVFLRRDAAPLRSL